MPRVTVCLPAAITAPEPPREFACEADTVAEALRAIAARVPRYAQRIFDNGRLLVTVALNGRQVDAAQIAASSLAAGDRIDIVPPVAGG